MPHSPTGGDECRAVVDILLLLSEHGTPEDNVRTGQLEGYQPSRFQRSIAII